MGRPAIADGVVDARGASRTQSVLARARDRCQGARRRAGHGRDRINARYRAADPRSTRQRQKLNDVEPFERGAGECAVVVAAGDQAPATRMTPSMLPTKAMTEPKQPSEAREKMLVVL